MKQCEKKLVFYICILDIYCNATSTFELIKCKENAYIQLVGNLNSCKGTPVDNIYGVECFAICYEPTSPIWEERGYLGLNPYSECDWLVYEEGSTGSDGLCTLCFSDSTIPATTGLGNTLTSLVYAQPSAICKSRGPITLGETGNWTDQRKNDKHFFSLSKEIYCIQNYSNSLKTQRVPL